MCFYVIELQKVMSNFFGVGMGDYEYLLLLMLEGGEGKMLLVVVIGDKGFCGLFNLNVICGVENFVKENDNVDLLLFG